MIFFYWFERDGEGETSIWASSINWLSPLCDPTGDWTGNLCMCPDWESNQQHFGAENDAANLPKLVIIRWPSNGSLFGEGLENGRNAWHAVSFARQRRNVLNPRPYLWPCHRPMGNGLMSYRQQIPLLTNSWQYLLLSIHSPGPEALPSPLVSEQVLAIKQNSVDNKWHSRSLLQPHLKWTTKSGRARYTRGHLQSPRNLAEGRSDFKIWELQEWGPWMLTKLYTSGP